MADIKQLNIEKGQLKGKITRLKSFFETVKTKDPPSEQDLCQLKLRLDAMNNILNEYLDIATQIEVADPKISCEKDIIDVENMYYDLASGIKTFSTKRASLSNTITNSVPSTSTSTNGNLNDFVKLPSIDLPSFSGAYNEFEGFRDIFDALINKHQSLTNIQKFYYLKSCLKGEAADVIRSLNVSADNYEPAWTLLTERFHNKKLMLQNNLSNLFNINIINKETSLGLRKMLDEVLKINKSLELLQSKTNLYGSFLIYLINSKLDSVTRKNWESFKPAQELPTFDEFITFLKERCQVLESVELSRFDRTQPIIRNKCTNSKSYTGIVNHKLLCPLCKSPHSIYACESFLKLSINERIAEIKRLHLCINCFRSNHLIRECRAKGCRTCHNKHNTLLHIPTNAFQSNQNQLSQSSNTFSQNDKVEIQNKTVDNDTSIILANHSSNYQKSQCLLATALVNVISPNGNKCVCRVLLDPGSQSNFITSNFCNKMGLPLSEINITVSGLAQCSSQIKYKTQITIASRFNAYQQNISCLVLGQITDRLPLMSFNIDHLSIPQNIQLADSTFNKNGQIDMLIGAGLFWQLLCVGQINLGSNLPIIQKTVLGWIISGNFNVVNHKQSNATCLVNTHNNQYLDDLLTKFWTIEEVNGNKNKFLDENKCEELFNRTTIRNHEGKFVVNIPFKENIKKLGSSKDAAIKRFYSLERKLYRNLGLKQNYTNFLTEYQRLGHMSKISEQDVNKSLHYYLPHHAIIKETSLTTKIRVVFDGSAKSSSGLSLNDVQYAGPAIQNDLFSILLRFRKHTYVVTADIEKMYRQILINPDQRNLQLILWRSNREEELGCYKLNTLTYGTASAPYLAVRCMKQLGLECEKSNSVCSQIIINDFYIDDLLTGTDNLNDMIKISADLAHILSSAGFKLRKWLSNNKIILDNIKNCIDSDSENDYKIHDNHEIKALGILWNAQDDYFSFTSNLQQPYKQVTKRSILSTIAQIFDPLGIISPITINAKIIIQTLWQLQMSWDESIPSDLNSLWLQLKDQLNILNLIRIPRHVMCTSPCFIELHSFCDASEKAYGSCIYIRTMDSNKTYYCNLLCSKTRVAPIKQITLPRLELCGAILSAKLVDKVIKNIGITFDKIYHWCDSTIVLNWINSPSKRWSTFVSNRVGEIQHLTRIENWHHIRSESNPADILSRGTSITNLIESKLWWHGPDWLTKHQDFWPVSSFKISEDDNLELRKNSVNMITTIDNVEIFKKYSSYNKLVRIISYCFRFTKNCKTKVSKTTGPLTVNETKQSSYRLIHLAQLQCYSKEIHDLMKNKTIHKKSSLLPLNPFLDEHNLLRVGGRIYRSQYSYDKKHQIILPSNHILTTLIMRDEHKRLLHCGPAMLLASIRERFWPISGRRISKKVVHGCIHCFKVNPRSTSPLMGPLPPNRVSQAPPFYHCGVDYAGPLMIKNKKGRGCRLTKAYICLFICFVTKAIHLELVSGLTTESFMASLRRFISRRGKPKSICSDNGSNFRGAASQLADLYRFLNNNVNHNKITNSLSEEGITWTFLPGRTPHMGGLWEIGVKSVKSHIKRVLGNTHLDYEDFYTLLVQIEAVLNSRPLCPISPDPEDFEPLTPSHFLIGRKLIALPDDNLMEIPDNKLKKYEHMQKLLQHIWARWSKEYVSELQTRCKWKQHSPTLIKVGSLVLLKEDGTPPLKWNLGRITELHMGTDNIVRIVSVKLTSGNIVKRSVNRLCVIPCESEQTKPPIDMKM